MIKKGYNLTDEEIARRYSEISHVIDSMPPYYYSMLVKLIEQVEGFFRLLDVGCGTGNLLEQVHQEFPDKKLFGIELSNRLLEISRAKLKDNAEIIQGNATNLPFNNSEFDIVICSEIIEHLKKPKAALWEAKRVLKPDGVVILGIPSISGYSPFWKIAEKIKNERIKRMFVSYEHPIKSLQPIDTAYTYKEIKELLSGAGLKILRIEGGEYFPYLLYDFPKIPGLIRRLNLQKIFDKIMNILNLKRFAYRLFIICKPEGNIFK